MNTDLIPQKCSMCGRERTLDDAYDYHPLQAMTGKPLGWYSGDDGEVCPECMTKALRGQL
jgi:DNA-directed RNA polymerase subunit RPC12/RpoP